MKKETDQKNNWSISRKILETWQLRVGTWAWQRSEKKNKIFFFYSNCKYSISINYISYYFWHIKPKKSNGTWTVSQMWQRGGADIRDTFYYLPSSAAHCSSPVLCCVSSLSLEHQCSLRQGSLQSSAQKHQGLGWNDLRNPITNNLKESLSTSQGNSMPHKKVAAY